MFGVDGGENEGSPVCFGLGIVPPGPGGTFPYATKPVSLSRVHMPARVWAAFWLAPLRGLQ